MKVTLKTLTPIHIGTGVLIPPVEFYKTPDRHLLVFNMERVLDRLVEKHGQEGAKAYEKWVNDYVAKTSKPRSSFGKQPSQYQKDARLQFNLVLFCKNELKDPDLLNEILKDPRFWRYRCRILATDIPTQYQLREQIKTHNRPYIPGSSLKGALRTALAVYVINHLSEAEAKQLWEGGQHFKGLKNLIAHRDKNAGEALEEFIFRFGTIKKSQGKEEPSIKYGDAKNDLLRFLHVSDAMPNDYQLAVGEMYSCTFKSHIKSVKVDFAKTPINLAELIDAESTFTFDLQFDANFADIVSKLIASNKYTDIEEKTTRLFGFAPHDKVDFETMIRQRLTDALREFSRLVINHDIQWLDDYRISPAIGLKRFYEQLMPLPNLLHLGFAAGWHSTTIGLALQSHSYFAQQQAVKNLIKQYNLDLTQNEKTILSRNKDFEAIDKIEKRRIDVQNFPSSRRLVAARILEQPDTPLGWCQLLLE